MPSVHSKVLHLIYVNVPEKILNARKVSFVDSKHANRLWKDKQYIRSHTYTIREIKSVKKYHRN